MKSVHSFDDQFSSAHSFYMFHVSSAKVNEDSGVIKLMKTKQIVPKGNE
jgi:hypothetical protein